MLALIPVIGLIALATAEGGVSGQVSKAWTQLTDPNAKTPANTPDRLTATASVRARYWREALDIHATEPWLGSGAGAYATVRTRFRTDALTVRHAHGYVVQTLADLGWVGLIVSLLAAGAWLLAAARATGVWPGDRGLPYDAERIGMLTLASSCWPSPSTRWSTGRGSCPPTPASPSCAPAGSSGAGRCGPGSSTPTARRVPRLRRGRTPAGSRGSAGGCRRCARSPCSS